METTTVCHIDLEQEHALSITLSGFNLIILKYSANTCKNNKEINVDLIREKKIRSIYLYLSRSKSLSLFSRAPDKDCFFTSTMPISSPKPIFDHMLESSHRDNSNKWSNRIW